LAGTKTKKYQAIATAARSAPMTYGSVVRANDASSFSSLAEGFDCSGEDGRSVASATVPLRVRHPHKRLRTAYRTDEAAAMA
jgi:hypothetical protein